MHLKMLLLPCSHTSLSQPVIMIIIKYALLFFRASANANGCYSSSYGDHSNGASVEQWATRSACVCVCVAWLFAWQLSYVISSTFFMWILFYGTCLCTFFLCKLIYSRPYGTRLSSVWQKESESTSKQHHPHRIQKTDVCPTIDGGHMKRVFASLTWIEF